MVAVCVFSKLDEGYYRMGKLARFELASLKYEMRK